MKLFVFDHCPYCVKAKMVAKYKKSDVEIEILQNHEVEKRVEMVGRNAVPILEKNDGTFMAESMDIAHYLDDLDPTYTILPGTKEDEINAWLHSVRFYTSRMIYARNIYIGLPEFGSEEAIAYYTKNKSAMIKMSFEESISQTSEWLPKYEEYFNQLDFIVLPSEKNDQISWDDVSLFPYLRNSTIIKGIKFPDRVKQYIDEVTKLCEIDLYTDRAI